MNELKPCPFCGDRGEVFVYYSCLDGSKWGVRCFSCGISQRVKHRSRAEAIEAWNMRDSEPVRHGHWEYVDTHLLQTYHRCSECGNVTGDYIINKQTFQHDKLYYCPNCGAKMDEVSE